MVRSFLYKPREGKMSWSVGTLGKNIFEPSKQAAGIEPLKRLDVAAGLGDDRLRDSGSGAAEEIAQPFAAKNRHIAGHEIEPFGPGTGQGRMQPRKRAEAGNDILGESDGQIFVGLSVPSDDRHRSARRKRVPRHSPSHGFAVDRDLLLVDSAETAAFPSGQNRYGYRLGHLPHLRK